MIDDIYRTVQVILNKNDKGVITPDRFNDLAKAVQLKILAEIPNDIRLAVNRRNAGRGESSLSYLQEALDRLTKSEELIRSEISPYYFKLPGDSLEVTSIYSFDREISKTSPDKLIRLSGISLVRPTHDFPVYALTGNGYIDVLPRDISIVTVNYRRKVSNPKWTYILAGNKPVFDQGDPTYQDFELSEYFFNRIVVTLLAYLGLHLREQEVIQVSQQMKDMDFRKENMA